MKLLHLFSALLLVFALGCNDHGRSEEKASAENPTVSDHAHLEEAKAITKKILEVMDQVEGETFTEEEFSLISDLQQQLNLLVYQLEEEEMEELNDFREELMLEKAEKNLTSDTPTGK